jgi:hypothetical protein
MDRCPAEIWSHIFSYACQDGGSTGCSLSLTSKYIRETSKSVRHRSVALCGVTKIFYFYHLFKRGQTSPITYLFLSDSEPSGSGPHNTMDALHTPPHSNPVDCLEPTTAAMVSDILRSNAISLSSLSIASSCSSLQLLLSIRFPSITDLSLISLERGGEVLSTPNLPETLPVLPHLRRLQLVNIDDGDIFDRLSSISPSVSHLHVTGYRLAPPLDKLPPTVQSILLQPASYVVDIDPRPYLQWLRHTVGFMEDTSLWTRITLLRAPAFRAPHNSYEARISWERTKGGWDMWWTSRTNASVGELLTQVEQAIAGERFLP